MNTSPFDPNPIRPAPEKPEPVMSTKNILFVDDDPNILAAYQRQLRKQFTIETALGPREGLKAINGRKTAFALVVADMQMPDLNGVEFLSQVRLLAPDTVRMMLTGNADQQTAMEAVNEGNVFRFLTKPCPSETLALALQAGLHQHQLITAERELLEKTLGGIIAALTDIIAMTGQKATGKAQDFREQVRTVAQALQVPDPWQIEVAGLLSHIGRVAVPPVVSLKCQLGKELTSDEQKVLQRVPELSAALIEKIPRLERTAEIIRYSRRSFDGTGSPANSCVGEKIPIGARILRVIEDLMEGESRGVSRRRAFEQMQQQKGTYDPKVVEAAMSSLGVATAASLAGQLDGLPVSASNLKEGQILRADIRAKDGSLLVNSGTRLSAFTLEVVANFALTHQIREPIFVENPVAA
jgi:response regulator RpfG family c-di-GMP phosphodiesterase